MYIQRLIETEVKASLYKGKIIIIYGARQVGKTTLVKKILSDLPGTESLYLNCDEGDIQKLFRDSITSTALKQIIGDKKLVVIEKSLEEKRSIILQISQDYLYKDILKFQNLKNSETIEKLLVALALQVGKEVSYTELASLIGVSKQTVAGYIDILEKTFVIFKLKPFSRNLRKELGKLHK